MKLLDNFNPKNSPRLFGLDEYFNFLKSIYVKQKFPKVILFTGEKGIGKFTLVCHLMHFIFDKKNYIEEKKTLNAESSFHNQFLNQMFPNIIYLNGSKSEGIKIDEVRLLKEQISKSSALNSHRFIIIDDVDNLNINSLNGLLKIIEEPTENNFFILINNKSQNLLETIKSRCLEVKVILNKQNKIKITQNLIEYFNQNIFIKPDGTLTSPGNFVIYNYILEKNKIDLSKNFLTNINLLINLYKKEKNILYKKLIFYYTKYYLQELNKKKSKNKIEFLENTSSILKSIDEFFIHNLNQNTLLNSLKMKIHND
tara:strand:+ start:7612 stop:8547 length:936 start_codon:yes stop_codon:yes gene_type:complete